MAENRRLFARAYRDLAAARPLLEEAGSLRAPRDGEGMRRLALAWAEELDALRPAARPGRVRRLFAEGITPAGPVRTLDRLGAQEYRRVRVPWGADAGAFLDTLADALTRAGMDAEHMMQPMESGRIGHLYIPGRRLLVAVEREGEAPLRCIPDRTADLAGFLDDAPLPPGLRETAEELLGRAMEALRQAKAVHDELEAMYAGCMDFAAASVRTEAVIAAMLEGRG